MNDNEHALKHRFKAIIETMLRVSIAEDPAEYLARLRTTFQRSADVVIVRLHWTRNSISDDSSTAGESLASELIDYRVFPNVEGCKLVVMVTREATVRRQTLH